MTPEELIVQLNIHGYSEYADFILETSCNSIRIELIPLSDYSIPIGTSKLGGHPDVAEDFQWPFNEDQPLHFMAQINCAEIKDYDDEKLLPLTGLLLFFYDDEEQPWGFDPEDKSGWKVIYIDNEKNLLRRYTATRGFKTENKNAFLFNSHKIKFYSEKSFQFSSGSYYDNVIDRFGYQEGRVDNILTEYADSYYERMQYKLLGYPDVIQGDMEQECQLASHGIYCGDKIEYKDPKVKELLKTKDDWLLLLQLDSGLDEDNEENNALDMFFGDSGRLYFWIRKQDLKKKNFENIWCVLQCT